MSMALTNLLAFQAAWLMGVAGAAQGYAWLGPLVTVPLLGYHFTRVQQQGREAGFLLTIVLLGCMLDQLLVSTGLLHYTGAPHPGLIPAWIVALWVGFATTLNSSLRWLQGKPLLAAIFGLVGGPLSYWAAARLGAVEMPDPMHALLAIAVAWAMIMPLLCLLTERFASLPRRMHHV